MTGADKLICAFATLLVALTLTAAPAKAQFGGPGSGGAGGQDMMTQMAPMLNMMKAKMGKKRFAAMMQAMGPMMGQMMQNGGGLGGGGFAPGGFGTGAGIDAGSIIGMAGPVMQMASLGVGAGRHRNHRQK